MEDALSMVNQTAARHLRRAQRVGLEEPGGHAILGVVTGRMQDGSLTRSALLNWQIVFLPFRNSPVV